MATQLYLVTSAPIDRPTLKEWVEAALNIKIIRAINNLTLIVRSDKSAEEILKILRNDERLKHVDLIGVFSLNYPLAISPDTDPLSALLYREAAEGLYHTLSQGAEPDADP